MFAKNRYFGMSLIKKDQQGYGDLLVFMNLVLNPYKQPEI